MENTTYITEKTLSIIYDIFDSQKEYQTKIHIIVTDYNFLDNDNLRQELNTYFKDNDKNTFDNIYKLAKQSIDLFDNHIYNLPFGVGQYENRRYKIRNFELYFVSSESFVFKENEEKIYICRLYKVNNELYNYCQLIIDYIDNLRGQTKVKELKIKTPKLNEFNKPELTQKQISILFKGFKEQSIFSNKYLNNTDFSKILSELTGYSENTLRQNLSMEYNVISDNKTDYEIIISKLEKIIKGLKEQIR